MTGAGYVSGTPTGRRDLPVHRECRGLEWHHGEREHADCGQQAHPGRGHVHHRPAVLRRGRLHHGCGVFGNQTGGVSPFIYKITAGVIPAGMGLSGFSLTKAFPSPAKDWVFTVTITDAVGATAKTTAKFHVFPHIAFTAPVTATCNGYWISGCTMQPQLQYILGTPNLTQPTVKVTLMSGPALPTGSSFTARSGMVSGSIPGQELSE